VNEGIEVWYCCVPLPYALNLGLQFSRGHMDTWLYTMVEVEELKIHNLRLKVIVLFFNDYCYITVHKRCKILIFKVIVTATSHISILVCLFNIFGCII